MWTTSLGWVTSWSRTYLAFPLGFSFNHRFFFHLLTPLSHSEIETTQMELLGAFATIDCHLGERVAVRPVTYFFSPCDVNSYTIVPKSFLHSQYRFLFLSLLLLFWKMRKRVREEGGGQIPCFTSTQQQQRSRLRMLWVRGNHVHIEVRSGSPYRRFSRRS